jgi:hypothetical protein
MLARQLCRPIAYDTVIMHTVPEHWPRIAECRRQNIGYTTWETNALPDHWTPLLALPDKVFVPSTSNGKLFARGASGKPVHVVPHIRRHAWNTPTPDEKIALRRKLGIPGDHFLFYTIGVWDPRKALGDLVGVFACQFSARDKVTLLIKNQLRRARLPRARGPMLRSQRWCVLKSISRAQIPAFRQRRSR